jgi:hypothetical protein
MRFHIIQEPFPEFDEIHEGRPHVFNPHVFNEIFVQGETGAGSRENKGSSASMMRENISRRHGKQKEPGARSEGALTGTACADPMASL